MTDQAHEAQLVTVIDLPVGIGGHCEAVTVKEGGSYQLKITGPLNGALVFVERFSDEVERAPWEPVKEYSGSWSQMQHVNNQRVEASGTPCSTLDMVIPAGSLVRLAIGTVGGIPGEFKAALVGGLDRSEFHPFQLNQNTGQTQIQSSIFTHEQVAALNGEPGSAETPKSSGPATFQDGECSHMEPAGAGDADPLDAFK